MIVLLVLLVLYVLVCYRGLLGFGPYNSPAATAVKKKDGKTTKDSMATDEVSQLVKTINDAGDKDA